MIRPRTAIAASVFSLAAATVSFAQAAPEVLRSSEVPATAPAPARSAPAAVIGELQSSADYLIGPEDVLDIMVWKNPELSRSVPVRPDGKVSLPLVNDVQAAGLSPGALRTILGQRLAEFVPTPEVSVVVREVHSFKVSVMGAVRMPGHYEIKSPSTVLDMLARAQGFTEFAAKDKLVVLRRTGARVPFNYNKVADGDQQNLAVLPGDIIVVP
jgi:polysaccharide export outer membrane protein